MRKSRDYSGAGRNKKRTSGTRYGMEVAGLDRRHVNELDAYFFKEWTYEQLLGVLALVDERACSQNSNAHSRDVPAVDPRTGVVTTHRAVTRSLDSLDWSCAKCRKAIVARVGDLTAENLLCGVCLAAPGGGVAASSDDPLVEGSVAFTDACRSHIEARRKYIMEAAARNGRILSKARRKATPR